MEQNALADAMESMRQKKLEQSINELAQELAKVNASLDEIKALLKPSDKTYVK